MIVAPGSRSVVTIQWPMGSARVRSMHRRPRPRPCLVSLLCCHPLPRLLLVPVGGGPAAHLGPFRNPRLVDFPLPTG